MIDVTQEIVLAQIAFGISVIAFVLVLAFTGRHRTHGQRHQSKKQ